MSVVLLRHTPLGVTKVRKYRDANCARVAARDKGLGVYEITDEDGVIVQIVETVRDSVPGLPGTTVTLYPEEECLTG